MRKDFKWIECFCNGGLKLNLLYANLFDVLANLEVFSLDGEIAVDKIDLNLIKDLYHNCEIISSIYRDQDEFDTFDKVLTLDDLIYSNGDIVIIDREQKEIICIDNDSIAIYYKEPYDKEKLEKLKESLPIDVEEPEGTEIDFVAFNQDYYTKTSRINNVNIDISENYNDDFQKEYDEIIKFLDERDSGLVLLQGNPGTGKSSIIKHLICNHPKHYIFITPSIAPQLASPEFTSFMFENRDSVFILEDCEQVIMDRNDSPFANAVANILNMSDGIMGDILNIKIIATFNNGENIDPALLRKGRCFVNYEFKKLCVEKTKALLNKLGIELESYEPMTLAEIYNYKDTDCTKKQERIGF